MFGFMNSAIGIDLGTANSLVFIPGRGIVLEEPSIVAIDSRKHKILAVGMEAKEMLGKTPDYIKAVRPLKDGVITDFEITQVMISHFIKKTLGKGILKPKPRVVVGVPSGVTPVEERAVIDAAKSAGAREVYLIAEPMAAAIGADLPISEPIGNMVVDIGGGTTDVAVISLSGIVISHSLKIAGDEMNEAIIEYIKRKFSMLIGEQTAEKIKLDLGSATMPTDRKEMEVRGRDATGLPRSIVVDSVQIYEALEDTLNAIVSAVKTTLEKTPPELAADIVERGIVLAGGGSLLKNMHHKLTQDLGIKTYYCEDPLRAVARGVGKVVDDIELLKKVSFA
jgi:rod shape-determining protein MreB